MGVKLRVLEILVVYHVLLLIAHWRCVTVALVTIGRSIAGSKCSDQVVVLVLVVVRVSIWVISLTIYVIHFVYGLFSAINSINPVIFSPDLIIIEIFIKQITLIAINMSCS